MLVLACSLCIQTGKVSESVCCAVSKLSVILRQPTVFMQIIQPAASTGCAQVLVMLCSHVVERADVAACAV
jgi:hypothetical protein